MKTDSLYFNFDKPVFWGEEQKGWFLNAHFSTKRKLPSEHSMDEVDDIFRVKIDFEYRDMSKLTEFLAFCIYPDSGTKKTSKLPIEKVYLSKELLTETLGRAMQQVVSNKWEFEKWNEIRHYLEHFFPLSDEHDSDAMIKVDNILSEGAKTGKTLLLRTWWELMSQQIITNIQMNIGECHKQQHSWDIFGI